MEFSFDFEMSEENKKVTEELLKQKGIKHYVLETKDKEKLDLVEYEDYKNLEEEKQYLLDYLKQKQKELKEYVCIYEEKLRNTKKEDYYYNSHLKTIHKYNAQRELIKEILSKIEMG